MYRIKQKLSKNSITTSVRPSQSLHSHPVDQKNAQQKRNNIFKVADINICILYKKRTISFKQKNGIELGQLQKILYKKLIEQLLQQKNNDLEKVSKIIKNIIGFTSIDGDVNFDYCLSLKKGKLTNSKFFAPLMKKQGKYKIYTCLAIGGFSKVYLVRSLQNGIFYAMKCIKKLCQTYQMQQQQLQSIINEGSVSRTLDHPFLVKLVHLFNTQHFYCLVFQYCPGGQLFYLLKRMKIMQQQIAKFYFLQVLYGIQYLHSKGIIYRDLKPQNILIDADGNCKIVDFGLSKQIQGRAKTFSFCGSAQYMAPQMVTRSGHSFSLDFYSLGALLFQLVTGLPPFYTKNHSQLHQSIIEKQITFPYHVNLSDQLKDLLVKLLHKDQKMRLGSYIGAKQIICHPWVGKINGQKIINKQTIPPYCPEIQTFNFDPNQLGDDQQQFTQLLLFDFQESKPIHTHFKNIKQDNNSRDQLLKILQFQTILKKKVKTENNKSKQNKFQMYKSKNENEVRSPRILQRLENKINKNISNHSLRLNQLYKVYPYLDYKQSSPKKQKQLCEYIEKKVIRMEKSPGNQLLKKIRIHKNTVLQK